MRLLLSHERSASSRVRSSHDREDTNGEAMDVTTTALTPETLGWMLDCEHERRVETLTATISLPTLNEPTDAGSAHAWIVEYARDHRN